MAFSLSNKPMAWKRISQPYKKNRHKGIDLAAPTGTPVYATANGTVVAASKGAWHWSYGNMVAIYHGNGNYTNHAHLSKIKVHTGQKVKAGQLIGYCGSTGRSTGPHLHFEIHLGRKWNRVNPKPYLDNAGKKKKKTKKAAIGKYEIGKTYTLQENMNVRIGYSVSSPRIGVNKWTKEAQAHATKNGLLKKGTKVTVKDLYKSPKGEIWVKTPSGWICAKSANGAIHIK